jgi:hypothetical protein
MQQIPPCGPARDELEVAVALRGSLSAVLLGTAVERGGTMTAARDGARRHWRNASWS